MNIFKQYKTSDYYYAEIQPISQAYEDFYKDTGTPFPLMFHHQEKPYRTLLLKSGEEYIDLINSEKKIVTERDNKIDCNVIRWKYSFEENDVIKNALNLPPAISIRYALRYAKIYCSLLESIGTHILEEQNKLHEYETAKKR